MSVLAHYPSLSVEFGAVLVLVAALLARILLRRFGVPSIVTLLGCGLVAGPSGFGLFKLDLTQPGIRALLSLAVVVVLFEATLRIDLRHMPRWTIGLLAVVGPTLTLALLPVVGRHYGLTKLVALMVAAVCVVTGPTVTGPLLARLRLRIGLSHLLETEGLVLDAIGVIIAAAVFASFTTRIGAPLAIATQATLRIGAGVLVGLALGFIGQRTMGLATRSSSDISKIYVLLIGFSAYALAELVSHESGLVGVVACGMVMDLKSLPHERLLRSFKEDLSMLALSTVFVLLASQIDLGQLGALVVPALAIVGALIAFRIVTVVVSTQSSTYTWPERALMMTIFPRGIVAVSLATYYATQLPAWGLRGGGVLAGVLFLVIMITIVISTASAIVVTRLFGLQMPSMIVAGISPATLDAARGLIERGHRALLVDREERAVLFARASDMEAEVVEDAAQIAALARERGARCVILSAAAGWDDLADRLPATVTIRPLESEHTGG
ncbi:MAG TPA: cation:proton antiporter [Candidatus Baltobacteraceae bacterium]|nr:cation:proton antiporter [Candidatus Baltobacteraceae bacterium]